MSDNLIATPTYEGDTNPVHAIAVIGPLDSAAEELAKGDWGAAIGDGASAVADAVGVATDPIAALAGSVAGFLLDNVQPLHQALEVLTGSPEQVKALGQTWDNIAKSLTDTAGEVHDAVAALLQDWHGAGAVAYGAAMAGFEQMIRTASGTATGLAAGLRLASVIVEAVYQIVKAIISALVGELISLVVEELASVGLGTPVVAAQATEKIATTSAKTASWVEKIITAFKNLGGKLQAFITSWKEAAAAGTAGQKALEEGIDAVKDLKWNDWLGIGGGTEKWATGKDGAFAQ